MSTWTVLEDRTFRCSHCGKIKEKATNYCTECGRDMRGILCDDCVFSKDGCKIGGKGNAKICHSFAHV